MSDREANLILALIAGLIVLAGHRRTRPLAGFLYGMWLSRAQGASRDRLEATIARLFDERNSIGTRVTRLRQSVRALEGRISSIEAGLAKPASELFDGPDGPVPDQDLER